MNVTRTVSMYRVQHCEKEKLDEALKGPYALQAGGTAVVGVSVLDAVQAIETIFPGHVVTDCSTVPPSEIVITVKAIRMFAPTEGQQ